MHEWLLDARAKMAEGLVSKVAEDEVTAFRTEHNKTLFEKGEKIAKL